MSPVTGPNHYERLGVGADASPDDIRRAYRARAKTAHPDAGGDPDEFRLLRMAFEALGNPLTRKAYDDELHIRPGMRWDAASSTGRAKQGWSGPVGDFTGDVEFPAYLQDITEAPWQASAAAAARADDADAEARVPAAEVAWWWPHQSLTRPVAAGAVLLVGDSGALVAIDAFDGRDIWRAGLAAPCACAPVVIGSTIITWTTDGLLHGLDLARGTTRWEAQAGPPSRAGIAALPGAVLVARADGVIGIVASADGKGGWSTRLAGEPSSMAADDHHAVVISGGTTIEAVELRKGRHRWRTRSRYPVDLPPVLLGGAAWASSGRGTLHRLDLATGAVTGSWSSTTAIAGAVTDRDTLYVTVAGPAQLVAIDPTGTVRWSVTTSEVAPEPDVTTEHVVLAEPNGRVAIHDREDGSLLGAARLPIEPLGPPVAVGDRVIVRERSGRLWAVVAPAR